MQSILLISTNHEALKTKGVEILKDKKIDEVDITIIQNDKAVGIGSIREILDKVYLRPLKGQEKGILILSEFGITTEAQNALLKILEEPPAGTTIIIAVSNEDEIIPTILSRCKLVRLGQTKEIKGRVLLLSNTGQRLKLAQDLSKDKSTSLNYLEELIVGLREDILKDIKNGKTDKKKLKDIETVNYFYSIIKNTNTNLRLSLENLFLKL